MAIALFLTIRTQPGKRDALVDLWNEELKPRLVANDQMTRYVLALDQQDANVLRISEIYSSMAAFEANSQAPWFAEYMSKAGPLLDGQPEFHTATPYFVK